MAFFRWTAERTGFLVTSSFFDAVMTRVYVFVLLMVEELGPQRQLALQQSTFPNACLLERVASRTAAPHKVAAGPRIVALTQ